MLDSEDEKLSPAQLEKSNSEKPTWDLDEQLMLARQLIERASTKDLPKETNTSGNCCTLKLKKIIKINTRNIQN